MTERKEWTKKQFIDSSFGAALCARVGRRTTVNQGGTQRWIDCELKITNGDVTVSVCDDLETTEQALTFLTAYVRELKAAKAWEDSA